MIETAGARTWLIRHGQSESNAGLPTDGPGAAPLTPLGRAQAERVAAAFTEPPALIVSSSFVRARETARLTRERFPEVPYEEWPVQEFTFLGSLHGPRTTNAERRPHSLAYWERCDPGYVNGGDGESFKDLIARTRDLVERLNRRTGDGLVAVFTHGLYMRALIWSLSTGVTAPDAAAMGMFRHFLRGCSVPNGAIVELRADPSAPDGLRQLAGSFTHLLEAPLTDTPPADAPSTEAVG
ncbi:histidine phosphatase family protein [Actinomadura rugatobispora]|uniref:Histidine phosphatase family protein n=1 Tax=Actinomadura rugatobispora TaxID=1994 RepID=A0ABW1AHJ9_9ACTN|nr:histidine phosphatase family protein [Actinomadura rugatobispora]